MAATPPPAEPRYVGAEACVGCHPEQAQAWRHSDHALAMQPASAETVLGDFDGATFTKDGVTSTFATRDGRYYVRTDGADGTLQEFEVAYTFGADPLQQYLIGFPDGRYQALSIAWDTRPAATGGQRWFHLYPNEKIDHQDVLHWTGPAQSWTYMCADCHSTNLQKNYRLAENRFATTWSDINVSCEACHGPGSRHVAWAAQAPRDRDASDPERGLAVELTGTSAGDWTMAPGTSIARRTAPLASHAEIDTCGPCHARRSPVGVEYRHGQALEQSYRVALLDEPLYHPDGQIRDEVYEYGSFLQSRMYQAGVTCSDCHDPHSARLRRTGNAVCTQCHLAATYDGPRHHFHEQDTDAARCISCHMIQRRYMVVDARRDHSFRVPRPDLSETLGTPNACTDCHEDRSARWAAEAVAKWYGPDRRRGWHYAQALHAGRTSRTDAERQLVRTIEDPSVPAIVRATAASLLPSYLGPTSLPAVELALRDADPLVRRGAVAALSAAPPELRARLSSPLLDDTIRTVRFEALSGLLDVPRDSLPSTQRVALDRVVAEYRQAQAFDTDRVEAHLNLGSLDARLGRLEAAEAEYRIAQRLQPMFLATYINLADLYRQRGDEHATEETLRQALEVDPQNGPALYALGLSLVRQKRRPEAIATLAKAADLRGDEPRYAYVHGVALHDAGQRQRALEVLESAHARHPANRDIVAALAEYHAEAGHRDAAIAWAQRLVELSPGDGAARRRLAELEQAE